MKTFSLLAVAAIFSTGVFAQQSPSTGITDKKQDMKDVRTDIRDVRKDKKERMADVKSGNKQGAIAETKDIKADKQDIRKDAKDLKADGVKHPIRRARRQIHHAKLVH